MNKLFTLIAGILLLSIVIGGGGVVVTGLTAKNVRPLSSRDVKVFSSSKGRIPIDEVNRLCGKGFHLLQAITFVKCCCHLLEQQTIIQDFIPMEHFITRIATEIDKECKIQIAMTIITNDVFSNKLYICLIDLKDLIVIRLVKSVVFLFTMDTLEHTINERAV